MSFERRRVHSTKPAQHTTSEVNTPTKTNDKAAPGRFASDDAPEQRAAQCARIRKSPSTFAPAPHNVRATSHQTDVDSASSLPRDDRSPRRAVASSDSRDRQRAPASSPTASSDARRRSMASRSTATQRRPPATTATRRAARAMRSATSSTWRPTSRSARDCPTTATKKGSSTTNARRNESTEAKSSAFDYQAPRVDRRSAQRGRRLSRSQ